MTDTPDLKELMQNVERDRRVDRRQKWWLFAVSGLLFFAVGIISVLAWQLSIDRDGAKRDAASEQSQKQEIASEAQAVICTADDVQVYDQDLCARLEAVATEPAAPEAGAKGDKGDPGRDGRDGRDGKDGAPGAKGDKGDPGEDSTTPGAAGLNGANGLDGAPGPPGKDGIDGKNGQDGLNGADGRGISSVTCEGTGEASYWVVTYTDGTSQTSTGPCRLTALTFPTGTP